jgi:hypothetical protein
MPGLNLRTQLIATGVIFTAFLMSPFVEGELNIDIVDGVVTGSGTYKDPAPGGRYSKRTVSFERTFDGRKTLMKASYRKDISQWTGSYNQSSGLLSGSWKGMLPGQAFLEPSQGSFRFQKDD